MPLNHEENDIRGLQLLADAATQHNDEGLEQTPAVSPVVAEALVLPKAVPRRPAPKRLIDSLPNNLTCPETIRQMTLRELEKVRVLANTEWRAKNKFNKEAKKTQAGRNSPQAGTSISSDNAVCMVCKVDWQTDVSQRDGRRWVACDLCDGWLHDTFIPDGVDSSALDNDEDFFCHFCIVVS